MAGVVFTITEPIWPAGPLNWIIPSMMTVWLANTPFWFNLTFAPGESAKANCSKSSP